MSAAGGAAAIRAARIRHAATSSIGSKVATLLVQLVAFPIAARALGTEQFAVYGVVAAVMAWLSFGTAAVAPGLVNRVAAAVARHDDEAARRSIASGLALAGALCATLLLVALAAAVLGPATPPWAGAARGAPLGTLLVIVLAVTAASLLLSVVEAAQLGYQEQHRTNRWTMVGNGLAFVALLVVARGGPGLVTVVLVVYGTPLLARLANAGLFLRSRRAAGAVRAADVRRAEVRALLRSGGVFTLVALASLLNHQLPVVLLARTADADEVAAFVALMNAFLLAFGLISTMAAAAWPALVDAVGRGEGAWAARFCGRAAAGAASYAVVGALVLGLAGNTLIRTWYGLPLVVEPALARWLGVYFAAAVWEFVLYNLLVGLQMLRHAAAAYVGRSALVAIVLPLAVARWGGAGAAAVLALSALVSTAWLYPLLMRRHLARLVPRAAVPRRPPDAAAAGAARVVHGRR